MPVFAQDLPGDGDPYVTQQSRPAGEIEKNILQMDPADAGRLILQAWKRQDRLHKRRKAQWKVNRLRRSGITGVTLIKRTDTQEWIAYAPPGTSKAVPALNKADRLCRLARAMLFTDPPQPEAAPSTDADEDRDAAEFSTRVLVSLGDEGGIDNALTASQAVDAASTYDSGFRHYYTDPQGGGSRPMQVMAAPGVVQVRPGDPESAMRDPQSGQIVPPPYVPMYVKADFTLTANKDDPQVQTQWLPALKCEVLTSLNVRFLPATARDIWRAQGVIIGAYIPLGQLKRQFPNQLPTETGELKKLLVFPPETDDLLPGGGKTSRSVLQDQALNDDALVWTVYMYRLSGPDYQKGLYAAACGEETLLYRGPWYNQAQKEPMDLPVDQFKQFDDEDDPYGKGLMRILGPANEIRAGTLGAQLEHLDRFLNRKVFIPLTSSLQPKTMQSTTGTYVYINEGGKPEYEQLPDFPQAAVEMFNEISSEMDHESGLEAPATGQNPPNVTSGLHARTILEQVNVGLSDLRNNVIRGLTRGWRIQLQLVKRDYTVPQRISWVGEDGAFKEKEWTGSDLGSTKDVSLKQGTLSMLAPTAKMAVAEQLFNMRDPSRNNQGILTLEELEHIVRGNSGGLMALQDDPHRLRIRQQISAWADGPPDDWQPQQPVTQMNPQTGQPQQVQPPDPVLGKIWAPVPSDIEPTIAVVRHYELARFMSTLRYRRWPQPWKQGIDQEYERMRKAANIQTFAEQAQAQQEQQHGQMQAQQQQKAQEMQMQQQAKQQDFAMQQQGKAQEMQMQPQMPPAPLGPDPQIIQAIEGVAQQVQQLAANVQTELAQSDAVMQQRLAQQRTEVEQLVMSVLGAQGNGHPPVTVTTGDGGKPARFTFERDPATGLIMGATKQPIEPPPAAGGV